MNPQDLAAARRTAQEAREDVGTFGMPRHTPHDLADLVDALVGEVEGLTRGLQGLAVEHEKLSSRLERSEAALRYYADPENYLDFEDNLGAKARAALSGGERS